MNETVADLLPGARDALMRYVRRHAGRLLTRETAEDVVQAIHVRALEHGRDCRFEVREAFLAWLYKVAASQMADRHAYWAATRRRPDRLLRLTRPGSDTRDPLTVREPPGAGLGPPTLASRKEELLLAGRALELLLPRDRTLVEWLAEDVPLEEQARRLGISYTAARQSRHRALSRFRKAFATLSGEPGAGERERR